MTMLVVIEATSCFHKPLTFLLLSSFVKEAFFCLKNMASLKAEKPVGTQLFGQPKKEPAKAESTAKTPASKPASKKQAAQKPQEPKKKGKGGKAAAKH